jgi:NADH-quinone oxidoreductase subunit N
MNLDYHALAPEIIVAVTILVVLSLDLALPRNLKWVVSIVGVLGLMAATVPVLTLAFGSDVGDRVLFDGSYVIDDFALVLKGLFLSAGYIVLLMSVSYIESDRYYLGEYYVLLLVSILGSVIMASSRDLITMFVGLELVTGPLFLLTGWRKGDAKSNEAALKFFILGVLSTAILLYGMSFLYGLTGSVDFGDIRAASGALADNGAFQMAVLFTLIGFAFKVSAVPFHFWAPDTYEGAPTPITAYLSVSSKAAGFVGLLVLTYTAFPQVTDVWGPAMWILAAASMTVGNVVALRQHNIVRMLAYSSIAQGGFMMVPFAAAASNNNAILPQAFSSTLVYVLIYTFMNLGAFAFVIAASRKVGSGEINALSGLGTHAPGLAFLGTAFFFSLAGIPPFAGWFAKFVMFQSVLIAGDAWSTALAVVAVVNAVVAFVYYARVAKVMWMDPIAPGAAGLVTRPAKISGSLGLALALSLVFVIVAGILPQITALFGEASKVLAAGL